MITIIIIILTIVFLCTISSKEPYSHVSPFYSPSDYVKECYMNPNKKCLNSRCIYSTLNECKEKCGKACLVCPDGMYMCNLN